MTLWLAAAMWIVAWANALIRGMNTHDPLEIARRLAISALGVIALALVITVLLPITVSAGLRLWARVHSRPRA
jgi:hypothetical protein